MHFIGPTLILQHDGQQTSAIESDKQWKRLQYLAITGYGSVRIVTVTQQRT